MKKYLCIDGGGTYIKHAVIDENEQFLARGRTPTLMKTAEGVVDVIEQIYRTYEDISGIAMSFPGLIDVETGYMHTGGSLQFLDNTDLANMVSDRCDGVPVTLENDAKAAASAELYSGALRNSQNGMVITIGTALGGTLIIERKIVRGSNLFAGEISYMYYSDEHMFDQPPANKFFSEACKKTFWALRCGPTRICDEYNLRSGEHIDVRESEQIFKRAASGDELAIRAITAAAKDFAMLLTNLQCMFDPEIIAVGGGISEQPMFFSTVQNELDVFFERCLPGLPKVTLVPCRYRVDANLLGAYYFHKERESVRV